MGLVSGVLIYFLIWWISLFVVLPMGVERNHAPEKGQDPGAPKTAGMKQKIKFNTLLAAGIWLLCYFVLEIFGTQMQDYFRNSAA